VFGAGPANAQLVLVGEAPGDAEDRAGHPFVGPAGRELDAALARAALPRELIYVTNAVKHFKFERRGARRIHQRPTRGEVNACSQWLQAELAQLRPVGILALGATAAGAVIGWDFRVTRQRGVAVQSELAPVVMGTIHPSAILRGEPSQRDAERAALVADLTAFTRAVEQHLGHPLPVAAGAKPVRA
jgi:DNA polymerase